MSLIACGINKPIIRYIQTECLKPSPPEEPVFVKPTWELEGTDAQRKFCLNIDGTKHMRYNVKRVRDALNECKTILEDLK